MDFSGNSEDSRHGEHELFVLRVRYQVAKRGIEVCATHIQEELEGKGSIDNLEKYMEEYEIWSSELICTHRNLVNRVPRGELKSIVRDCINFCRLHKEMVVTARRLIKEGQPQHAHTHTEDGTSVEEVSVSENVRNISSDVSDEKRIPGSVNRIYDQTVERELPISSQGMVEMQGSWGDDVELPVSGTVADSDGIDTSAAEQSSIVESTRLEELAVVPQITAPVPSPRSSLLGTQCMQHAEQSESAGLENCVQAGGSPGVTSISKSVSSSALEQQHQQLPGQSRQRVHSAIKGLGDGRGNSTKISHMATLLGVMEVECKNEFLNRNCYKGKSWRPPDGSVLITSLLPQFNCVSDDRRRSNFLY